MKKILVGYLGAIVLLTTLIAGCSTAPVSLVTPPPANRLEILKKSIGNNDDSFHFQNESENIAKAYLQGLKEEKGGHALKACDLFTDLFENQALPIKEVALVHRLQNCDLSKNELINIWNKTSISNYLREAYIEQSLKLAAAKELNIFEAQFSFDLIDYRNIQAEKIKLVKRAIAIAEKQKDSEKVKKYSERLKEISPLYETVITEQNIYKIAKDFEANHKFDSARALYQQIIDGGYSIEDKVKAYNAYRTSYKVERNLKTFLLKTIEMETFLKAELEKNPESTMALKMAEYWVDAKIASAKAVWTDHRNLEAKKIIEDLIASKAGSNNQMANMQLIYGSLCMENKKNADAVKHFETAETFKVTDIALKENIQWAVVWNNYLLKRYNKVVNYADSFIKKSNNPNFTVKLNYWKAKALQNLNHTSEANELFASIFSSDPFGYYGIISTIDLKTPLTPITPHAIDKTPTGINILDWLISMDEKKLSAKYLKEINPQFKTTPEREKAMPIYAQTEWFQGGMRQLYNLKMSSRNAITEKYINIIFPTPYMDSVEKLSEKYAVPKELIYGITRQESAFVPSERSWADAFGLMQLIPERASELSRKYKIPYHDYNDLYDPEINLEMGTALLKNLREKFNSKFAQSVAAYNANEKTIAIWEKERFNGNYFEFIEMIPYEETRNYIKLVFRNFIIYKRITSKESFMVDKDFFALPF